ncbi:putative bifunctional diguanylate cyclase/phosphodiesterase [Sphingomonas profundi]|uniref:putative bifunctional diguanylate cyclase/phosphodiesterase n=1 Tax=Alterirhizorhabdus profundi TaxID=2681549 RepID=UPI0012E7EF3F|nr:EAL domain-containing protein [Sphingomonas profundi]
MPRFQTLRAKLSVLYAGLFVLVMVMLAIVAQLLIAANANRSVRSELVASSSVFGRIWTLRARALGDSAEVLAHDFGFRSAVATGDRPTIASALANLRSRARVASAFVTMQDGTVIGSGPPVLRALARDVPFRMSEDGGDAVVAGGGMAVRMVVAPILAPTQVGSVVFAVPIDSADLHALERLSSIPLTAMVVHRNSSGLWTTREDAPIAETVALNAFVGKALAQPRPETLRLRGEKGIALARALPSVDGKPEAVLLLSYPLAKAMAPFRSLQFGILGAGILGLLLVLAGSIRLARGIAEPIAALDRAARALGEGEFTKVPVIGDDEVAHLAASFNAMADGIVFRENRIAHLAFHDTLTSLPNRVLFREQLDAALRSASRRGTAMALLCLDLDGFKAVNDTLGHPIGDKLLREIATLLEAVAEGALVSRLGGDEFAIILADQGDDRARLLAQAILDRMRRSIDVSGHQIATGSSIGIAIGPADGEDADTLLKNADLALYRAKQDGRGVARFFEPALDAAARRRRQMEIDLREALANGQLSLDFQPIYALVNDSISGFEALLRWHHPEHGLIPPVEFIPVAEDTGLIQQIGEWVIHEACRQAMTWPGALRVAVNVSPLQFRNPGLANIIFQAIGRSGLPPARLEIEITESIFLDSADATLAMLHRLRTLGIRIALDDFGTGYSSLSYLRSFPFDKIKIDRSFVTDINATQSAAAIVHAIVDLARALGMETTAEGVEDERQLTELRQQGCSSIQGYLMSRPIPAGEVVDMLLREAGTRRVA